jgi:hypothetical protein
MKRMTTGVLALSALILWQSNRAPAQGKVPEIREAMKKMNGGTTGLYFALGAELREATPDWDDARRMSKEVARLAAAVPKGTPPKGDKASWDKLAKAYADGAVALDAAVARKDAAAARAAFMKLGEPNCKNCHMVHRKE